VHEALDIRAPALALHQLRYLRLLERRAVVARASISRILADPRTGPPDYTSEDDHIHQSIADLAPDTYRHRPVP